MMPRLATPQEGTGEADAPDPVVADDSDERAGGEMLPADGVS
jgi:hypothetical protein